MTRVVLTGATGGLGHSLAMRLFDKSDIELVCLYRNKSKFENLYKDCENFPMGYLVKKEDDFSDLIDLLEMKELSPIVLILNAFSLEPIKKMGNFTTKEIESVIYGNLTRNFLLLNAVISFCKKHSNPLRIINLDSGAADFPLMGWSNYCAAKAYMKSLMEVIAVENPTYQIVSFDPGVMDTHMQEVIRETDHTVFDKVETFIKYKKDHELNNPDDVAKKIIDRYVINWRAKELREKYK